MADLSRFEEATAAVKHSPHAVSAWEEAEELAAELDKPDDIIELFNATLKGKLEVQVAEMIGERAGRFCDEWFGDDPKVLEKILLRVLQLAPSSESALIGSASSETASPSASGSVSVSVSAWVSLVSSSAAAPSTVTSSVPGSALSVVLWSDTLMTYFLLVFAG